MEKYLRALPGLTAVSEQVKAMANIRSYQSPGSDSGMSGMKRDAEAIQKIMQVIREIMINPFQHRGHDLVSISTSQHHLMLFLLKTKDWLLWQKLKDLLLRRLK